MSIHDYTLGTGADYPGKGDDAAVAEIYRDALREIAGVLLKANRNLECMGYDVSRGELVDALEAIDDIQLDEMFYDAFKATAAREIMDASHEAPAALAWAEERRAAE